MSGLNITLEKNYDKFSYSIRKEKQSEMNEKILITECYIKEINFREKFKTINKDTVLFWIKYSHEGDEEYVPCSFEENYGNNIVYDNLNYLFNYIDSLDIKLQGIINKCFLQVKSELDDKIQVDYDTIYNFITIRNRLGTDITIKWNTYIGKLLGFQNEVYNIKNVNSVTYYRIMSEKQNNICSNCFYFSFSNSYKTGKKYLNEDNYLEYNFSVSLTSFEDFVKYKINKEVVFFNKGQSLIELIVYNSLGEKVIFIKDVEIFFLNK